MLSQVTRKISVDDIREALAESLVDLFDGVDCAPARPVAIRAVLEVRFEDRFQHKLGCGLRNSVSNGRDTERSFAAARLGNHDPAHRIGLIRLVVQFPSELTQPLIQP